LYEEIKEHKYFCGNNTEGYILLQAESSKY